MAELDWQKLVVDAVKTNGGHAMKASNRFLVGVPDVYAKIPGCPSAWVEVKWRRAPVSITRSFQFRLDVTAPQCRFLELETRAGGVGLVASFMTKPGKSWASFQDVRVLAENDFLIDYGAHVQLTHGARGNDLYALLRDCIRLNMEARGAQANYTE